LAPYKKIPQAIAQGKIKHTYYSSKTATTDYACGIRPILVLSTVLSLSPSTVARPKANASGP